MKKQIVIVMLVVMPTFIFGQDIFDRYQDNDEVTFVSMQPKMFQMLGKMSVSSDDPEAQDFFTLVNSITSFKVMTTENASISKEIDGWVNNRLSGSAYEELMRVKDGNSNVKFYVKEGKDENHVKDLLMFVTGISDQNIEINGKKLETVLLSLTGDIDLRQIAKLTDKMDLPGGDQLGKAANNK